MKRVLEKAKRGINLGVILLMMLFSSGCVDGHLYSGPPTNITPPAFSGMDTTLTENESLYSNDVSTTTIKNSNFYKSVQWLSVMYRVVVYVTILYLLISFVMMAVSLARYGSNPQKREEIVSGFIRNLIAIAILGGAEAFAGLFWNMLS